MKARVIGGRITLLGVTRTPNDSQRRNRADGFDEEAIAQLLCIPGQDFSRTAVGRQVRIMRTNMTTLTKTWMTLLLSNILPSDHNSDLPLPKC